MLGLSEAQKRRFFCRSYPRQRRDIDGSGGIAPLGMGCVACQGCSSPAGDLGIAGDGSFRLVGAGADGALSLVWACPGCGIEVHEGASPLGVEEVAAAVAADPLCHRCRTRKSPVAGGSQQL